MRFPLALTARIARHIISNKIRGVKKFATVLQLEPLHTCNLTCTGCGRIREYSTSIKDLMPLEDCLQASDECGAPMVSICGGEPLIYPHIEDLVAGLLKRKRIVYVCTNAMFMRKKMRDYLATLFVKNAVKAEAMAQVLVSEELMTQAQADEARKGPKDAKKTVIAPTQWMYWNVHLDGLERTHDLIVEREGVFKEAVLAMRMAKVLGYQVATNTTVYKETEVQEIEDLFQFLNTLNVDGHTIAPGYEYDAAKADMVKRLGIEPENFFLTRKLTIKKFAKIEEWGRLFPILGTPVYLEFLAGKRDLTCSAWAIPTRNVRGWKGPCYLMTDGHYAGYQEMLREVKWENYGVVDGKARDPRCENCMVHCGYDPSGALSNKPRDTWINMKYNFGAKPKPFPASADLEKRAFNGVTIGKGHLAEAKAAINPAAGARGGFTRKEEEHTHAPVATGGGCSTGDTSQRDDLLAKIKANGTVTTKAE